MPAGRPRKPTAELRLHGSLDHDKKRHVGRASEPQPTGEPTRPSDLAGWAKVHWEKNAEQLVRLGIAKQLDEDALASMCEWWAEWKQLQNGEAGETGYKRLIQMAMCHKQWRDLASRFGLTPSDRANLTVDDSKEHDPAAEFIA